MNISEILIRPEGKTLEFKRDTDSEIKYEGLQALIASLGDVNAERFITLISREPFDYTRWQKSLWTDKSVREISSKAMAWQKENAE